MQTRSILITIGAALALAACGTNGGEAAPGKDSPDGSRSFAATDFTGVELAGSDDVVVTQGAAFSVVATGPQAVLDQLDVTVTNGVLVVSRKPGNMSWSNDGGATVTVTLPALVRAEVSGSGDMTVDRGGGDRFAAVLAGSGNLDIGSVEAKAIAVSLAGSGDIKIKAGKAASADISLAGSGDVDTSGVTVAAAAVSLAGSGDVELTATTTAKMAIVGSGDVKVGGGAKCESSETGSGTVRCT